MLQQHKLNCGVAQANRAWDRVYRQNDAPSARLRTNGRLVYTDVLLFLFVSHISSIFQNIRRIPWSHNWAHSSPTRN